MSEIRLVAMRFVPSDEGGYWTPAADGSDTAGFQDRAWADAWDAGITEEEARRIVVAAGDRPTRVTPNMTLATNKLDAAFNEPVPEDSPDA